LKKYLTKEKEIKNRLLAGRKMAKIHTGGTYGVIVELAGHG
jgi:hypothetical protein